MPSLQRSFAVILTLGPACAAVDGDPLDNTESSSPGGKADDIAPADFACQKVNIAGGLDALASKHDPIAELLLKSGDSCPTNYEQMVVKLREQDPEGCTEGTDLRTRIVSDDARLVDNATNYRTFTTRACGSGEEHHLSWTLLNVKPTEAIGNRTFIELMAFDPTSSLYNFYTLSGGWNFKGSTLDVLDGSIACASCHNGGGLIMKELDDPWIHWESPGAELPGATAMFENHGSMFGVRGDGKELEQVVRGGNEAIIDGRIRHHSDPAVGSVRELLRPLFCQVEINLDTAGTEPGQPLKQIPADFFVDPHFDNSRTVPMSDGVYEGAIASVKQHVPGVTPSPRDTAFKFVFPERAGIDNRYVQRLIELGIVDTDFATDVLAVDFTQPLFSSDRCALLEHAPTFETLSVATPETLREAFIEALSKAELAPDSAGTSLLVNLGDREDAPQHRARVDAFLDECAARPQDELMADVLRVAHGLRERARGMSIIEHSEQLPDAALESGLVALDPSTCVLADGPPPV